MFDQIRISIRELKVNGKSLYAEWLNRLDRSRQHEVDTRMKRVKAGAIRRKNLVGSY